MSTKFDSMFDESNLDERAAKAAAAVLDENWTEALAEGHDPALLLPDLERVMQALQKWAHKRLSPRAD